MFFLDRKLDGVLSRSRFSPERLRNFATMFHFDKGAACVVACAPNCDEILTGFDLIVFDAKKVRDLDAEFVAGWIVNQQRQFGQNLVTRWICRFVYRFVGTRGQSNRRLGISFSIS